MARTEEQPSIGQALLRILEATQRLLVENVRLARTELGNEISWWARHGVWLAGALVLALSAYILLSAGLALLLADALGLGPAVLVLAGANLAGGAVLAVRGLRRIGRDRVVPPQPERASRAWTGNNSLPPERRSAAGGE